MAAAAVAPAQSCVVGALACQKDSYLQTFDARVITCEEAPITKKSAALGKTDSGRSHSSTAEKSPSKLWQIEFNDSVLFPEGGGQPTDHGTITNLDDPQLEALKITKVERQGLRSVCYSPRPLEPGTNVRQTVDFTRRWDHMQQHTGQHLLSAIMDTYEDLETVGWGMGAVDATNYVDLSRKPSEAEMQEIQDRCNRVIRENVAITVEVPEEVDASHMPDDYDTENGVMRVIRIEGIDANPCCGTHLAQTSHIALIVLLSTHVVHGKHCRLHFVAGDRAVRLAASSINSLRSIASIVSSTPEPSQVVSAVTKLRDTAADLKKREAKLVQEIAKFEAARVRAVVEKGENAWLHRAAEGQEFINVVVREVRETVEKSEDAIVVIGTGEEKSSGQLVILGESAPVADLVKDIQAAGIEAKGGGRPGLWQGKVVVWKKGELRKMENLVKASTMSL